MAVTIVSSDKDLMQLIRPGVSMLDPIKQKTLGAAEVMEKFGVPPDKVVEVQALMGDSIDNVPGVPGIGPKNAAELIQCYGDVEAVLAAAPGMKPSKRRDNLITHAEAARISRKLVELCDKAPMPLPLDALGASPPDNARLADFLHSMGFRSTALRLNLERPAAGRRGSAAAAQEPAMQTGENTKSSARPTRYRRGWTQAIAARRVASARADRRQSAAMAGRLSGCGALQRRLGVPPICRYRQAELTEPRLALADAAAHLLTAADRPFCFEDHRQCQACRACASPGRPAAPLAGQRSVPWWPMRKPPARTITAWPIWHRCILGTRRNRWTKRRAQAATGSAFAQVPVAAATAYAAEQADVARRLHARLYPGFAQQRRAGAVRTGGTAPDSGVV